MTSIAPAGVYVWGDEDPKRPIGGASFNAAVLAPSDYNRDLIQPSAPAGRRRAPMFASQLDQRSSVTRRTADLKDAHNTSERPTPSASAVLTPEPLHAPSEFDRDLIEPVRGAGRRLDG